MSTDPPVLPAIARPMVIGRHVYGRSPSGDLNCVCGWTGHPTLNRDAAYAAWEAHATAPEPRVVDVDSLATDEDKALICHRGMWAIRQPNGIYLRIGADVAAAVRAAIDAVRAPLLADIAFITASSQSMQREFVDVMAERDTARAEAHGLRIDNGRYEDLTVEQDSAARSKIRALTADLAAARAEAANLRDLIRDIRIACLGAQFPSDGDHGRAWEAFDKAGIDA